MADRDWADETAAELFPCTCTAAFREAGIHHRSCLIHNRPQVIAALEVARAEGRRDWMLLAAGWHDNASVQCLPENVAFHKDCAETLRLVHKLEEETRRALAQQDALAKPQGE